MKCPQCRTIQKSTSRTIIDSRPHALGVRRRRECPSCGKRFSTYELPAYVLRRFARAVKKPGNRWWLSLLKPEALINDAAKGVPSALAKVNVRYATEAEARP
jgi:transcriptional regulator NrdR family protein